MSDANEPDLYKKAVGDGTPASPKPETTGELVVDSNASNYGASAVTPQHVVVETES